VGFDVTDKLLIRFLRNRQILDKNGSIMRKYISYSETLRKLMIELGVKYCTIFS
jgi:hypothetical protein